MKEYFWKFVYELKYAFVGLVRHFWLSFSAMVATAVTLLLIGVLTIAGLHGNLFSNQMEDNLGIHVILKEDIHTEEDIQKIQKEIEAIDGVDVVRFSDKDEELEKMIVEKGEAFSMYRGEDNPLSNAFVVYTKKSREIQFVAQDIQQVENVESVAYGGDSTIEFVNVLNKSRMIGYVAMGMLLVLSLYLIYNTIRTMIASRGDEIIIMRQVGATNGFVKRPFEWEGIILGLLGALIPYAILFFSYAKLYESLNGRLFAVTFTMIPVQQAGFWLGIVLVFCGIGIGWLASWIATSKYIKEKR